MASTNATTTTADKILKTQYLPEVREMCDNATVLLKMLEKSIQPVEGKNFTNVIHVSRNQGAGVGAAEWGDLPTAGSQGYASPIVPCKFIYAPIGVTGPSMKATQSNKGSYLRILESEMKGATKDLKHNLNRMLHSDGRDALGFWVSGASTDLVFDDGLGNAGYDFLDTGVTYVDGIDSDNVTVNYGINSTGAVAVTATKTTLAATGRHATLSSTAAANVAVAAGDFIVKQGSFGNQMTGIQAVISNANPVLLSGGLHGLTVASNPDWVAQFLSADGGTTEPTTAATRKDLSTTQMQQVLTQIALNSDYSEDDVDLILCSHAMKDTYVKLCKDERISVNQMTLDGGFKAVGFNGKPIVADKHCRHNRMYFINTESMKLYRMAEMDWMEEDGAILQRVPGKDAYSATMYIYEELACLARNANGILVGVSELL